MLTFRASHSADKAHGAEDACEEWADIQGGQVDPSILDDYDPRASIARCCAARPVGSSESAWPDCREARSESAPLPPHAIRCAVSHPLRSADSGHKRRL